MHSKEYELLFVYNRIVQLCEAELNLNERKLGITGYSVIGVLVLISGVGFIRLQDADRGGMLYESSGSWRAFTSKGRHLG